MIQIHKSITLTPFHPTNGGMNAYRNMPSGRRVVLSNDNRFTPIVTAVGRNTWEPMYGISSDCSDGEKNGVPGVFGETFNIDNVPHQIVTNGIIEMPTNMYLAAPNEKKTWLPGQILVLIPKSTQGWQIGVMSPIVQEGTTIEYKYSNQQIGILLEPLEWVGNSAPYKPAKPKISVLVGYSRIPKRISIANTVKAAPLATPKVATK